METVHYLILIAAVWFAAVAFWLMKEYIEHLHWDLRREAIKKDQLETQEHMAAKAMQVNTQAEAMMRKARRAPGDDWMDKMEEDGQ